MRVSSANRFAQEILQHQNIPYLELLYLMTNPDSNSVVWDRVYSEVLVAKPDRLVRAIRSIDRQGIMLNRLVSSQKSPETDGGRYLYTLATAAILICIFNVLNEERHIRNFIHDDVIGVIYKRSSSTLWFKAFKVLKLEDKYSKVVVQSAPLRGAIKSGLLDDSDAVLQICNNNIPEDYWV